MNCGDGDQGECLKKDIYFTALSSSQPIYAMSMEVDLQICYDDLCEDICPTGCNAGDVLGRWNDAEVSRIAKNIVTLYEAVVRRLPA